jgi:plastocyanin
MGNFIGSKRRLLIGITLLIALLSISYSCTKSSNTSSGGGGPGDLTPGANEVWIQSMAFNPSTRSVAAGTTITWTNKDAITHTVTSDINLFDSGSIPANGTYSHSFATAGTFTYHCTIHPTMTASVVVN